MTCRLPDTIDITLEDIAQEDGALVNLLSAQYAGKEPGFVRTALEKFSPNVWTNEELLEEFEVEQFSPPYVIVIRKQDGVRGTVAFTESPRFYFYFCPTKSHDDRAEKTV